MFEQLSSTRDHRVMERLVQRVYRRDEWLDRFARVYNGSALPLSERVSYLLRDRELKGTLTPEQQKEVNESLVLALGYLEKAKEITTQLAMERNSLAGQTVHGWSLHNFATVKLLRWQASDNVNEIMAAIAAFRTAVEIRERLTRLAPDHSSWKMDLRWTKIMLNRAEGLRAHREQRHTDAAEFFARNMQVIDDASKDDPNADDWHYRRAENRTSYAEALLKSGKRPEALQMHRDARATALKRKPNAPTDSAKRRWQQL